MDVNRFDSKPDKSTWLEMSETLSRHGFTVQIVTSYAKVPYVPDSSNVVFNNLKPSKIPAFFRLTFLIRAMFLLIRQRDREAIYILSPAALFIVPFMRMFGLHNIHLDVRTPPVTVHGWKKRLDRVIFWRMALRAFTSMVKSYSFITPEVKQEVEDVSGRDMTDSCIWSSGVRTSKFSSAQAIHDESSRFNFFYHGTITLDRGVITMVKAAASLAPEIQQHIRLTVIGSGPDAPKLVQLIESAGWSDFVNFKGFVQYEDIPEFLAQADCCICPLPDRKEWQMSSPLKIFEYMAAAKPIVATPITAHSNVLDDSPYVVWTEGFDVAGIAKGMETAYENRQALSKAAAVAPNVARSNYDWELIGRGFAEYLKSRYE